MNRNVPRGKWKQVKGETKKIWGKLTHDDLDYFDGQREKLTGKAQETLGHLEDKIDTEYNGWRTAPGD